MSNNRTELVRFIAECNDPRVLEKLMDIISCMKAGESLESIAASYGIKLED